MGISNYINFFKKKYYLTVFISILIFWFLIIFTSGSMFSGYHFTDDHEIVHMNYNLTVQKMNIVEVFSQWINNDYFTGRFRPFYYIHRIIATKFFGLNFPLWSMYTGLLAVFTTFFLFIFGRLMKFSTQEALLFSFLTTLGTQSAVWWQLGPAETIGTFLLSAALVLARFNETVEQNKQYKILCETSLIFLVLMMSLSKESFILFIPAIAFIKIFNRYEDSCFSWNQTIKQDGLWLSVLGLIFCAEILVLKFLIGLTPDIGYAGIGSFSLPKIILATKSLNQAGSGWIVLACLTAILLMSRLAFPKVILHARILGFPVTLLLLMVVPQILLYAKSGISQRYLLPAILGYSFLVIDLYRYINKNYKLIAKFILFLIIISLCSKLNLAWAAAHIFGLEGKSTNALLRTVEAKTTVNDPILIVTNPMIYSEWNFSIKKYFNYVPQRNNLYVSTYVGKEKQFVNELEKFYNFKTLDRIKNKPLVQCIIILPEMKKIFLRNSSSWFDRNSFEEYKFGNFNRNLNKDSKIYLYCKK